MKTTVKKLKKKGKTVYSYLNAGALETYRSYYNTYKKYTLGAFENREDERWVNVSKKPWQKFIGTTLAGKLVRKGVDGFFVDNCDVYYQYKKSKIYNGLNAIMKRLRKFKKTVLINGGDAYVTKLTTDGKKNLIDGVYKPEPVIAEGLPEFTVKGSTDLPGNFYISFPYSRNLIMLNGKGEIVWSKHEDYKEPGKFTGFWDFKKHVVGGKTYYSYHDQISECDDYGLEGFGPGERVILDSNFNEVKRIRFEESDVVEAGHPLDGHDFLMIDLNHYILSGYIKDRVTNIPGHPEGSSVVFSYLQEVKDGKVVWEFKSIDYPELYGYTVTDASETANDFSNTKTDVPDYVHFNSMRLDKDGNIIASFRHINSILCLDRSRNTDQIRWRLSGKGDEFGLTDEQKTSAQHYATIDGDYITAFNNGNNTGSTSICSYKLDAGQKRAEVFRQYFVEGRFSSACGCAQRIKNETYMIGWGRTENDAVCMSVYDFAKGKELLSVELSNPRNFTYRCVYY